MHAKMSCGHGRHDQDGWITAIWNILLGSARGWLTTTSTSTSTLRCTVSWNRWPPPLLLRLAQHGPLVSSRWMVVQTMHVVENTNVVQSLFRSTHTFHTLLMRPMSGDTRGKTCNDLRLGGGGGGPKGCSLYLSWEQPWSVGSVGVGETALESLISWPLTQWPALHLPLTIRCLRWNYPRLLQNWAQRNSTAVDHLPDHFNRFKQDYGS